MVGVDKGGGGLELEENSGPAKIGCHFIKFILSKGMGSLKWRKEIQIIMGNGDRGNQFSEANKANRQHCEGSTRQRGLQGNGMFKESSE